MCFHGEVAWSIPRCDDVIVVREVAKVTREDRTTAKWESGGDEQGMESTFSPAERRLA